MTESITIEEGVLWIVKNWNTIPNEFKSDIRPNKYSDNLQNIQSDEHYVILILNRQKPSVVASYDFDEERIGITRTGKVIWGFDSGCSCPSPWDDSYPSCYNVSKSWKEFEVNLKDFDKNVIEDCLTEIKRIMGGQGK